MRADSTRMRHRFVGLSALVVLAVVVAGCGSDEFERAQERLDELENPEVLGLEVGEDYTLQGVVVENLIDPCVVEDHPEPCFIGGPLLLQLDVDGVRVSILYSEDEHEACDNRVAARQGDESRVGDRVEVFGQAETFGTLNTCLSEDYSIEQLE